MSRSTPRLASAAAACVFALPAMAQVLDSSGSRDRAIWSCISSKLPDKSARNTLQENLVSITEKLNDVDVDLAIARRMNLSDTSVASLQSTKNMLSLLQDTYLQKQIEIDARETQAVQSCEAQYGINP